MITWKEESKEYFYTNLECDVFGSADIFVDPFEIASLMLAKRLVITVLGIYPKTVINAKKIADRFNVPMEEEDMKAMALWELRSSSKKMISRFDYENALIHANIRPQIYAASN